MARNWKLGLTFALITTVMWGLLPLALSDVLKVMDPWTTTWYRFSISAIIALLWYGLRSRDALIAMLHGRPLRWSALAVLALAINYILYVSGLARTNPGASQILIQIAPLLLLIVSVLLFRERLSAVQWLGVLGFSLGLLLFFHQRLGNTIRTSEDYTLGALMVIGAAIMWTGYGVGQKKLLADFHAKDILLLICLGGSILFLPLSEPAQIRDLNSTEVALLLFCGLNTIVAYGAFGLALSYWEASRVSAIIPLTPLLTLCFTYLLNWLFGLDIAAEPLDWLGVVGALMVVAGSAMAALPPSK